MAGSAEVVILGGGVLGFTTAYHLAREGIMSQVVEADAIGAKASGKADGMFSDAASNFFYYAGSSYTIGGAKRLFVSLAEESYRRFRLFHQELKELTGLDTQCAYGTLLRCALSEGEEQFLTAMAAEAGLAGLPVQWISGDEARAMEGMLSREVRGAVLLNGGQVEPYRHTLALAQGAERLGASVRYARSVGFRCQKDRVTSVLLSSGGEISAGKVVIAMGPWSGEAVSWLGLKLAMRTVRAQTLKMVAPVRPQYQLAFKPPGPEWPRVYILVSPRVDGTLLVGYTEERPEGWDDASPETWADAPTAEMRELIMEQALRFVPALAEAGLVEHRAAVLGYASPEGVIMGPVPGWRNVYITTVGDSGIALSPAVGRTMADLLVGGERASKALEEIMPVRPEKSIS